MSKYASTVYNVDQGHVGVDNRTVLVGNFNGGGDVNDYYVFEVGKLNGGGDGNDVSNYVIDMPESSLKGGGGASGGSCVWMS